jgi:hypothetical protein
MQKEFDYNQQRELVHFLLLCAWLNTCNNILWWKVEEHMYILISKKCMLHGVLNEIGDNVIVELNDVENMFP